jgi:hypothetical protein
MKAKFTAEQLQDITNLQAKHGITRKAAIRKYIQIEKANKKFPKLAAAERDFKQAAANDDTPTRPVVRRKPKTVKVAEPVTAAGSARAEGLRLYKLAGRPKKNEFIHVYGKPGVAATWERRAAMVGLDSAEKAAAQFQKMLALPKQSCLIDDEPKTTKGAVA